MPYSKNRALEKSLFLFLHVYGVHACVGIFLCGSTEVYTLGAPRVCWVSSAIIFYHNY